MHAIRSGALPCLYVPLYETTQHILISFAYWLSKLNIIKWIWFSLRLYFTQVKSEDYVQYCLNAQND